MKEARSPENSAFPKTVQGVHSASRRDFSNIPTREKFTSCVERRMHVCTATPMSEGCCTLFFSPLSCIV